MSLHCIVMAAGRGTRLRSQLSKMLIPVDGRPLVAHAVGAALSLRQSEVVVVVGHQGAAVKAALRQTFPPKAIRFAVQKQQRGTGDAVSAGLKAVRGRGGSVLILSGDVPLLTARTLGRLRRLREKRDLPLAMLTMTLEDPARYGRVLRKGREVVGVCEYADATRAQREIDEVNAGIYCVELGFLRRAIGQLDAGNAQGELYLTDLVAAAAEQGGAATLRCDPDELRGINTWSERADLERVVLRRTAAALMAKGVAMDDPDRVRVQAGVKVAADSSLGVGVELSGRTRVGRACRLGAGVILRDCSVGDGVEIGPYSVLEGEAVPAGARLGPHSITVTAPVLTKRR